MLDIGHDTGRQAVLHYDTPDFDVVKPGQYVVCAVTGARIALQDLRYWSADFQEAYRDADCATRAIAAGGAKNLR